MAELEEVMQEKSAVAPEERWWCQRKGDDTAGGLVAYLGVAPSSDKDVTAARQLQVEPLELSA